MPFVVYRRYPVIVQQGDNLVRPSRDLVEILPSDVHGFGCSRRGKFSNRASVQEIAASSIQFWQLRFGQIWLGLIRQNDFIGIVSDFDYDRIRIEIGVKLFQSFDYFVRPEFFAEGFGLVRSEEHTSELQSPMYLVC